MKYIALFTTFLLSVNLLSAATYAFNNGSSSTANGIVDTNGLAFRSGTNAGDSITAAGTWGNWTSAGPGILAVGIFSTDAVSSFNKTQLISSFTNQFGPTFTFGAGPGGQRSTFGPSAQTVTITGSPFAGSFMYLFAGNGTTFENSTQFLVLKHSTAKFLASDDLNPNTITYQFLTSNSTLLFGSSVVDVPTTNTDASTTAGWAMVAPIPETSTSLLAVLGVFGLLRRRR
jgi:hypothetical protein